jgi:hypothetical protein
LGLKKCFNTDPGFFRPWTRDVKIRIQDPGSGINIPDPQHWIKNEHFRIIKESIGTEKNGKSIVIVIVVS